MKWINYRFYFGDDEGDLQTSSNQTKRSIKTRTHPGEHLDRTSVVFSRGCVRAKKGTSRCPRGDREKEGLAAMVPAPVRPVLATSLARRVRSTSLSLVPPLRRSRTVTMTMAAVSHHGGLLRLDGSRRQLTPQNCVVLCEIRRAERVAIEAEPTTRLTIPLLRCRCRRRTANQLPMARTCVALGDRFSATHLLRKEDDAGTYENPCQDEADYDLQSCAQTELTISLFQCRASERFYTGIIPSQFTKTRRLRGSDPFGL